MSFTPTVASANRAINQSRQIYQAALDAVAEGKQKLQNEVDAGRLTPGTPEYLDAKNKLVNSAQSFAESAKLAYDEDLARLDTAREANLDSQIANRTFFQPPGATTTAPVTSSAAPVPGRTDPEAAQANTAANADEQIVPANQVTPNAAQDAGNTEGYGATPQEQPVTVSTLAGVPPGADPEVPQGDEGIIRLNDGANLGVPTEEGFVQSSTGLNVLPEDVPVEETAGYLTEFTPQGARVLSPPEVEQATAEAAARDRARQQQTLKEQRKQSNNGDWRFKISLAPQANYLYKMPGGQDSGAGILWPLRETNGVIFPYTPTVQMRYRANYNQYDLTHSNYRGYFYQNSYVEAITVTGTFTAQSTSEADYVLAVIHFFRSVTKMFYGQDVERGSPPPLVYVTGMGEYQFNRHACVVQDFSYTLPADVDYIRARSVGQAGLNLTTRRDRQSQAPVNTGFSVLNRLQTSFLSKGAEKKPPSPATLGVDTATYVPTKLDIQLTLLPMQSRSEISQQFSLKQFANGDLLKGGFW